jgi:hypothetical protein
LEYLETNVMFGFHTPGSDVPQATIITSSQISSTNSSDEGLLAYEPTIIKGRGRERLWHVYNDDECKRLCKMQLTVQYLVTTLANNQNEHKQFKFAYETKKSALCWLQFLEAIDPKAGTAHVACKHCKWVVRHPNHDVHKNTGAMKKYLETCFRYQAAQNEATRLEKGDGPDHLFNFGDSEKFPTSGAMTQRKLCEQVLRIITAGNLSFSQAENPELLALERHAYPNVDPPNRRSVAKRLKDCAFEERMKLKDQLERIDSKVSLALDAWTTRNNAAFLGIPPSLM